MKTLLLSIAVLFIVTAARAQDDGDGTVRTYQVAHGTKSMPDSIKLRIDGNVAYYQKTFKLDSNIKISTIYVRALQFMAAKNFQQNYGYDQEGKMIYTSTQDLNPVNANDYDEPGIFTVQFAITIDIKNGRYRSTVNNVTFYLPSENGNKRVTLYEMYKKETGGESKRVARGAKSVIDSFEKYLIALTNDLYTEVEHKADIYNSKF